MHKIKFPTLSFPNKLLNGGTEFYCITDLMKDEEFEFLFVDLMTFRKCFVDKWKLKLNENFICIYQKSKTSKIKLSTVSCTQSKLYVTVNWCNFAKENLNEEKKKKSMDDELPPLLKLMENEKFRNKQGRMLDVETRGEKHKDKILFKVDDIGLVFGIQRLRQHVVRNDRQNHYQEGKHYMIYQKKYVFLTFSGVMTVVYRIQNDNGQHFRDWAEKICFVHKMGSDEEKAEIGARAIGMELEVFKKCINLFHGDFPIVYLICIGKINKRLRTKMHLLPNNYSDNMFVFKYGYSANGSRRVYEHMKNFEMILNTNNADQEQEKEKEIKLKMYKCIRIDPLYLSKAETYLKDRILFEYGKKIKFENYKEIIGIELTSNNQRKIKETFNDLSLRFSGRLEIMSNEFDAQLAEKEAIIAQRETIIAQKEAIIAQKKQ